MINEEEIYNELVEIVNNSDINVLTAKQTRNLLEKKHKVSFTAKKQFIKGSLVSIVEKKLAELDNKKTKSKESGLSKPLYLSPLLSKFLDGKKTESRLQVVKKLWEYIKENNLQDPADKRQIIADEVLFRLFDRKKFSGFSMNKYLSCHFKKDENDEFPSPYESDSDSVKAAKNITKKKKRKRKRSSGEPSKPNGFTVPIKISSELSSFLGGKKEESRAQVVKALWKHIKDNDLQDPKDKRTILCDSSLKSLFNIEKTSSFGMNKLIQKHFIKDS